MTATVVRPGVRQAREELLWTLKNARVPKRRSCTQFAEEEIVLPDGRWKNQRFRLARQPYAKHWLRQIDLGQFQIYSATGPTQSGKTLHCALIPLLWHLFELKETVVFGVPDEAMAADKWLLDILPVIEKTRYASFLPATGEGSRGGKVRTRVIFKNGAVLRFMTGGGGDKQRAGFTSRVLVVTETDGFDFRAETSDETNKLGQLVARTMHYGALARIYLECTVTTKQGPIWQHYAGGTESELVSACQHCRKFVNPSRDHLLGWQESATVKEAQAKATFYCPQCGEGISKAERTKMVSEAVLLHRGQSIDEAGQITGEAPATDTLGFRWTAWHNLFLDASDIATEEWRGARDVSEDNAERKLRQFLWCIPYEPPQEDLVSLNAQGLTSRQGKWPEGLVPAETKQVGVGCDVGKWRLHYKAVAFLPDGSSHVFKYGEIKVESDKYSEDRAIREALEELKGLCETGWTWEGSGRTRPADQVVIDAGYKDTVVYGFIRDCWANPELAQRYWPSKGFGEGQFAGHTYHAPKRTGATVKLIGDHYHVDALPAHQVYLLEFDADHWKHTFHTLLACDVREPGALTLFRAIPREHVKICRHWTAEKAQIEYDPKRGEVVKMIRVAKQNHWLDAGSMGLVGGHLAGVRIPHVRASAQSVIQVAERESGVGGRESEGQPAGIVTPSGQPFFILER